MVSQVIYGKGAQNPLLAFHAAQLEAPLKEMGLMIEEAGHVQRATDTAVLIMQTEVQEKFGTILAIVGVVLLEKTVVHVSGKTRSPHCVRRGRGGQRDCRAVRARQSAPTRA